MSADVDVTSGRDRLLRSAIEYFATNGIRDASLRHIAAGVGTSHRMLIYHFRSREGLLGAVVEELERTERDTMTEILGREDRPARELAWQFWTHVADVVEVYGPLYFELASHAMRTDDTSEPLRRPNIDLWVEALTSLWRKADLSPRQARVQARLNLAVARGLLHDLLLTGDRRAVDQAMVMFDWLCFREPNPVRRLGRMSANWSPPHPD